MTQPDDAAARLARALDYPYGAPAASYTYRAGAAHPFDPGLRENRTPVLAYGSNRAPEQLNRKFGHAPATVIPVEAALLADFDVVHAAALTRYGAVPAMLQHAPGTVVSIMVTWLGPADLEAMHASELGAANYRFAALDGVRLTLSDGRVETVAFSYVGARGAFGEDGMAVAQAALPAQGRRFRAATTAEMLERYRARLAPDMTLEAFIHRAVRDTPWRRALVERLEETAHPFAYPTRDID